MFSWMSCQPGRNVCNNFQASHAKQCKCGGPLLGDLYHSETNSQALVSPYITHNKNNPGDLSLSVVICWLSISIELYCTTDFAQSGVRVPFLIRLAHESPEVIGQTRWLQIKLLVLASITTLLLQVWPSRFLLIVLCSSKSTPANSEPCVKQKFNRETASNLFLSLDRSVSLVTCSTLTKRTFCWNAVCVTCQWIRAWSTMFCRQGISLRAYQEANDKFAGWTLAFHWTGFFAPVFKVVPFLYIRLTTPSNATKRIQ